MTGEFVITSPSSRSDSDAEDAFLTLVAAGEPATWTPRQPVRSYRMAKDGCGGWL
ncbi:hypothetical protein Afe05nite_48000 [Paractinoplanes ferrugineus]|uniref:Uncharacterized protein n=1 Tax=Paractinoplanes ferrugineus TaxID=113564 RepID=A0A919MHT0_9ACTN|nr:hypothetical protein Afe05nite_48000 [Actinoplanes ferrugineus]